MVDDFIMQVDLFIHLWKLIKPLHLAYLFKVGLTHDQTA
jgi:hypothetical protein